MMKTYASYAAWLADQSAMHRRLVAPLRKLVKKAAPDLEEIVKWGNGCHARDGSPIIFLYAGYADQLQFGFFQGAKLDDPKGRLEGKGAFVRHVKIRAAKDIDAAYFTKLIRAAAKLGPIRSKRVVGKSRSRTTAKKKGK